MEEMLNIRMKNIVYQEISDENTVEDATLDVKRDLRRKCFSLAFVIPVIRELRIMELERRGNLTL